MIEAIAGHNNVNLGLFGITYAAVGLSICLAIILPRAVQEARKKDGIWKTRISLPLLVIVIIAAFGMALITTLPPLFEGNLGTERGNFSRFYYGSGIGTVGILLLVIYKFGGTPEE